MSAVVLIGALTFNTTLWANSADEKLVMFFLFFPTKQDLSPMKTVFKKCLILFSGKNKKKYFKMSAEILPKHYGLILRRLGKNFSRHFGIFLCPHLLMAAVRHTAFRHDVRSVCEYVMFVTRV